MKRGYLKASLIGLAMIGSIRIYQSVYAQAGASSINMEKLGEDITNELFVVVPILEQSITYIDKKQFSQLEAYLNKHKSDINLTTLFGNLGELIKNIGGVTQSALADAQNTIAPHLNAAQKKQLAQAINAVKSYDFSGLSDKIQALDVNLSPYVSQVVASLKKAGASPNFITLVNSITKIGNNIEQQSKLITGAKINTIALGLIALKKKQEGKPFNVIALLDGLGAAERLAPVVTALVSDGIELVTVIDTFLQHANIPSLPPALERNLQNVKNLLEKLKGYLNDATKEIAKAKKAAGLG